MIRQQLVFGIHICRVLDRCVFSIVDRNERTEFSFWKICCHFFLPSLQFYLDIAVDVFLLCAYFSSENIYRNDDDEFRFNDASTHEGHLLQNGELTWFCNETIIMITHKCIKCKTRTNLKIKAVILC